VRALAREVLVERGYTVLAARSGADALQLCVSPERVIHLLLTDMVMPGMSGPQLAERLTSRRAGVRVLYMSGYAEGVLVKHGLPHPDAPLLPKPFTPWDLARMVRQVLDAVRPTDDRVTSPALEAPPPVE
jgi:two-component system, cell cycle sensor histidine kinase and response regulator CckA